jgi:hypothetical protein
LVFAAILIGAAAGRAGCGRRDSGLAIGLPLALLVALEWEAATPVPGVSYLVAWPLLGAMLAAALLITASERVGVGRRLVALALCAAPVFLLIVPLMPSMIVALGLRDAAPILAIAVLVTAVCLLPQLVLVLRGGESIQVVVY